jgi:ABC-type amino acid transport substrate-binding protein
MAIVRRAIIAGLFLRTWLGCILLAALLFSSVVLTSCGPRAARTPAPAAARAAKAPAPTSAPPSTAAPAAQAPPQTVAADKAAPKAAAPAPPVVITTPTPPNQSVSAADSEADWNRIRAAERLTVGMSPDYRPFVYYNDRSELDGFDVAVVQEIGRRLGLAAAAKDVASGALTDALRLREVDLALLGPSELPAGEGMADFSEPYYVCRDVILAAEGVGVGEVRVPADLAGRYVGVLGGSRHEAWLQRTLLDTGQMQPTGLFTFSLASEVVNALRDGQIDLAIFDNVQAQPLLEQGGVRVVGQDLNRQNRSLAVPKGFDRLRTEVDRALAEMAADGTLERLTSQHLGLELTELAPLPSSTPEPTVTPTPSPSPTAAPPPGSFTADPIRIAPGECTRFVWNIEDVREVYFYLRGQAWERSPATGQESRQVCPAATGTYELRIVDTDGSTQVRSITIVVDKSPPLPITSQLATDPSSAVKLGACVKLSWEVRGNPEMVQIARDESVLWANAPAAGSMEDCPPEAGTVVYGVLASAPGQATQTQRVITVNP